MKIGLLTGGGDAPGLNGVIESVTRTLILHGHEVVGILDGFEGVYAQDIKPLNLNAVRGISSQAGTILGTSNKSHVTGREKEFLKNFKALNLDGLIVGGGDGTFSQLAPLKKEIPLIGLPKTIDNDITGTDYSFGYDTACSVVAESVHNLKATAKAHQRIIFVEVMGRNAGWIALGGGLSSYADAILIPERPYDLSQLHEFLSRRSQAGQRGMIVVIAEGAYEKGAEPMVAFHDKGSPVTERLGGVAETLARYFDKHEFVARHVVLGHLQRSYPPTASDKMLTLSLGVSAARLAMDRKWGQAVVYKSGQVSAVPLEDLMKGVKTVPVDHRWVHLARDLDIFI